MEKEENFSLLKEEKKFTKILLMGKAGVGKTSMKSIIFQNQSAKDTLELAYTNEIEETHIRFMSNINLAILDCSSREHYIKKYFDSKKKALFSNVNILIFIAEAENYNFLNSQDIDDTAYFENCLKSLSEFSPNAKIFVLINKMDKVDQRKRDAIFLNRQKQFESKNSNFTLKCYPTSIWETTLYKAWSGIVESFVPNIERMKELLGKYSIACKTKQIVLFEKNSFLVIASFSSINLKSYEKLEKICAGLKKFKDVCKSDSKKLNHFLLQNIKNHIYIEDFINNTCIMIVLSDKNVSLELLKINLEVSKKSFSELMNS